MEIYSLAYLDLIKSTAGKITRTEAKKAHKDLPEGGVWRTIKGHHVYIVGNKIVAGSIPGVTKAKKMTKAQMKEHQAHMDKEKGGKSDAKGKSTTKPKTKPKASATAAKGKGTAKTTKPAAKTTSKAAGAVKKQTKAQEAADGGKATKPKGHTKSTHEPTKTSKPKATPKTNAKQKEEVNKRFVKVQDAGKAEGSAIPKPTTAAEKSSKASEKSSKASEKSSKAAEKSSKATPNPDATTKNAPAKAANSKSTHKNPKKGVKTSEAKDIRSDAQKNRELAYDVGEKVGGARKDEFIASFKDKPTAKSLEELEKMSGAVAEKMVTKANLLPKFDAEHERDQGTELPAAALKKLIFDRIAPKPDPSTPETRKAYMTAMTKLHRQLAGIKTWDNMRNAIRELSDYARNTSTKTLESHARSIIYFDKESKGQGYASNTPEAQEKAKQSKAEYEERLANNIIAKDAFNMEALGDKLNNFFTDWDSRERTMKSVQKAAQGGWEKYLGAGKAAGAKKPKEKGAENKKWERKAEAEHLRTGGKAVKVDKPEQLMKDFGLRGVEFGNWVNDSSGKYHLQRSAEALHDLAETIGVDPKDISLNGRLALAFGARGKGTALAHYEPDRKVINMTKYGGAGSLAHEWGHAMDNILQQYSEGGRESLSLASQGQMGEHDPKLKVLYDNLIDAITKPAPGDAGGTHHVLLDSSVKSLSNYYPEMRRQIANGMEPKDVYTHWTNKIDAKYDHAVKRVKENAHGFYRGADAQAKEIKKYESKRKREKGDIAHHLAHELRLQQNGGKYGGDHYKGHVEVPTGKSEYASRMETEDGGKGKEYWGSNEEMFARVFESWVQHKLDSSKRYNNYLVHGTREGDVKAMGAPFPIGKERQHMFKAMDNLMAHVSSKSLLQKAIILEILANNELHGDVSELIKAYTMQDAVDDVQEGNAKRNAYTIDPVQHTEVIYIPLNRLKTPYQTNYATNWDKVQENVGKMQEGQLLEPLVIGFDYDIHDGHHRYEASKELGYSHVPCVLQRAGSEAERQRALEHYQSIWT